MKFDSLQFQALEEKLSAYETVIATQQTKIDSASMIVHDTKIAEGHFTSIFSTQLGIFLLIITIFIVLVALISWQEYKKFLTRKDKNQGINIDNSQNTFEELKTMRSLALTLSSAHDYYGALMWTMRLCTCKYIEEDHILINLHLEYAEEYASKSIKTERREDLIDELNGIIQDRDNHFQRSLLKHP